MKTVRRISRLKFDNAGSYFNSASIGISPYSDQRATANSAKKRSNSRANDFNWDEAVGIVQEKFGKLLGQPTNTISIFHNTTAGVQRTLLRLGQLFGASEPTLLLTDLEYPGIVSAVDEEWPGRVVMASLCDLIWRGEVFRITDKLKQCIRMARPSVVYISHIARATGYRIEEEEIISFIRATLPKTVIVIDGAQACGNILVSKELLDEIDIYVTSGHKWLSGKQTLGLVYAAEQWRLKDPAQSYSMTSVSTGTGSEEVIRSLQKSLTDLNGELTGDTAEARMNEVEQHNGDLAEYFSGRLASLGIAKHIAQGSEKRPPNRQAKAWKWNGIATIVFDSPEVPMRLQKMNRTLEFTSLPNERWRDDLGGLAPGKRYCLDPDIVYSDPNKKDPFQPANFKEIHVPKLEGYVARFCFHYYHSSDDVNNLISLIREAAKHTKSLSRAG